MGFELRNVAGFLSTGNAGLDDTVNRSANVRTHVEEDLVFACVGDFNSDGFQISRYDVFLVVAAPEQPLDATGELLTHRPAKRQPEPSVAWMTQHGAAKVKSRLVRLGGVMIVNRSRDGVDGWRYGGHLNPLFNCGKWLGLSAPAFPLYLDAQGGETDGAACAAADGAAFGGAEPSMASKPFTSFPGP